jgi:hypothetical protein
MKKNTHVILVIFAFAVWIVTIKQPTRLLDKEMDSSVTMDGTILMTDSIEVVNDTTNSDST